METPSPPVMGQILNQGGPLTPLVGRPNPRRPSYPNKIFSLADYSLPKSINELFDLCAYFFTTSSLVHPVIHKMAEYPITRFTYAAAQGDEQAQARTKRLVERQWRGRNHLIEVGINYLCFGNAIALVPYNCIRYLKCPRCRTSYQVSRLPFRWVDYRAHAQCPNPTCKYNGVFNSFRSYPRHERFVQPVLLDPRFIDIRYNPITGAKKYLYRVPPDLRRRIRQGDPYILETISPVVIEAVRKGMRINLDENCLFHFMRPGLSACNGGWGMPAIAPAMKDLYYLNTLKRAQEAISLQHIVPLLILFPKADAAGDDPIAIHNAGDLIKRIEKAFAQWRKDPNTVPIMPTPIGVEHIGGDARALLITPEVESSNHTIINAMLAPRELVEGGLSWSGSSISLRILENHFLNYRNDVEMYLDFALDRVRYYLNWPYVGVGLEDFRMADDIQKVQLEYAALQEGHLSRSRFLEDLGIDPKRDSTQRMRDLGSDRPYRQAEALVRANAEGAAQVIMARYQSRANQAHADEEQQAEERAMGAEAGLPLTDPEGLVDLIATMMLKVPEPDQAYAITMLEQMPSLGEAVKQRLSAMLGNPEAQAAEAQDQEGLSMEPGAEGPPEETEVLPGTDVPMGAGAAPMNGHGGGGGGGGAPVSPPLPTQRPPRRAGGI